MDHHDLQLVIQQHQEALEATPKDHPEWADRLHDLANSIHEKYLITGAELDLDLAIQKFQETLEATPKDHRKRASRLQNLGIGYCDRYERSGAEKLADLELAIQRLQEGVEATPHNDPQRADRLQNLGVAYFKKSERTGTEADLDLAMEQFLRALEATPEDDPKWASRLECLGGGYHERHQQAEDDDDLELTNLIQKEQDKLDAMSDSHPNWSDQLQTLGNRYHGRYLRSGVYTDIEVAIQKYEEALEATPRNHPDHGWANRLHTLGGGYHNRYLQTGAKTDLELAIQRYQGALEVTPKNHPEQASRHHGLGKGYLEKYLSTGAESDIVSAIDQLQKSLEATPKKHPERGSRLGDLGTAYRERYQKTGAETDLELAIQNYQDALQATPKDHPDWHRRLHNLGNNYLDSYIRRGAEIDLELAIQNYQDALNATPKGHPDKRHELQSLGSGYLERYQRTGHGKDLELAIKNWLEVLEVTPSNHSERAGQLQNLGSAYRERYRRTGSKMDLELAIQQNQAAVNATPKDHPDRAGRLQNHGNGYHDRYLRNGAEIDLDLAIQQYQGALEATPKDHPGRAVCLQNLGTVYRERYLRTKAKADLELAIQQYQEALKSTPKDHPERASQLQYLGRGYHDRYLAMEIEKDLVGIETDLELAIQQYQEALEATPKNHPERAGLLQDLGRGYGDRYRRTESKTDLELSIQHFTTALHHPSSIASVRIDYITNLIELQLEAEDWPSAYETAFTAMSLISQLTPRFLDISDKQHLLIQVSGLASDAAAIALMVGKTPYEALRLLELGRGVIIGSINEMRLDISDLLQQHSQLAEEFIQLRNQLNAPTRLVDQTDMSIAIGHHVNQRHDANEKLENTIQTIRRLPGFQRFLMAPSEEEIKAAAGSGPIVIINISIHRCDALIVDKNELKALPLPGLEHSDVQARAADLRNLGAPDVRLLEWLWDMIAKPILDALGLTQAPGEHLPRIWWIPTGPLAQFPIHAAGYHFHGLNTVIDRVISSYSSSISALFRIRHRHATPVMEKALGKAVLVGMGKTPGLKDLSFVPLEMERVEHLCGSLKLKVSKPQPYREDILSALNDCDLFHFAGHGESDPTDPSQSSLVLHREPLVVADLFETNLLDRRPFLAYLSACGTGQVKNDVLIDEALHLIAAYQIAGFRHVVGTLWEVNDRSCVEAATTLYKCLHEKSMSDESVSEGLHRASMKLRELWISGSITRAANRKALLQDTSRNASTMTEQGISCENGTGDLRTAELYEDMPLNWVPYVHFGI